MTLFYSAAQGGFYDSALGAVPVDAVEITAEEHAALLAAQSDGAVIQPGEDGRPVAVVPSPPPPAPRYVPVPTMRERLEAAGLWDVAAAALAQSTPMMLKLLTLREGVSPDDAEARAFLAQIGADPDAILAP